MGTLKRLVISYKWGFPFKLIFEYKGQKVTICTINEAEDFLERIGDKLVS